MKKSMPRKGMGLSQTHAQGETVGKAWPMGLHRALNFRKFMENEIKGKVNFVYIKKKFYLFLFKTETFIH